MYTIHALVVFLSLVSTLLQQAASWTQQYGDASSTNFVNYRGPAHVGWKYITPPYVSQTSPSVSEDGVIFYPLVTDVIAIAPNGTILWKCSVTHDQRTYLTNTVYSKQHGLVVVAAELWGSFDVVAVYGGNGTMAWTSTQNDLFDATTISISVEADAVYIGGHEKGILSALQLKDGKILWKTNLSNIGIFMQTKVGPVFSKSPKQSIVIPSDPFDGIGGNGNLLSYEVSKPGTKYWNTTNIGFSAGGLFAFSNQGMIFGRDGGGGGPQDQQMFGLHSQTGTIVFNGPSYCQAMWSQVSGPAVDAEGYAYYNCGNQVFSIYQNGSLRWLSKPIGKYVWNFATNSPSIHPNGHIYIIHNDRTKVMAVNSKDGSLYKLYNISNPLGFFEPPILLGQEMMYLIGFVDTSVDNSISIYPMKL